MGKPVSGTVLMGQYQYIQALDHTKGTKTKVLPQYREEPIKESGWPPNLGKNEDDDLGNDQQAVHYRPENACRLVGHSCSTRNGNIREGS
jgi:hypothetical protein